MFLFHRVLYVLFAITTVSATAQSQGRLMGRIDDGSYISAKGDYKILIPVLRELGGSISDTPDVVVFRDNYSVHVSVGSFAQDATQRWELSTRGLKEYLPLFFSSFVMPDFIKMFPGTQVESAVFQPNRLGGALLCFTLMPGGSMFPPSTDSFTPAGYVPVAKRGNLVFIQNNFVYVVSVELAEKAIEGESYGRTEEEENQILRKRLAKIVDEMQFAAPKD